MDGESPGADHDARMAHARHGEGALAERGKRSEGPVRLDRQGVYAVAGDDPKASTETKGTRMGSKQPLESTPMSIGDFDFMSQKCLPGSIECVHLTGVAAHNCPLVFQLAGLQVVNSQRRQDDHSLQHFAHSCGLVRSLQPNSTARAWFRQRLSPSPPPLPPPPLLRPSEPGQ